MPFQLANKSGRAVLVKDNGIYDLERHSGGKFGTDPMAALGRHGELHEISAGLPSTADAVFEVADLDICVPRPSKIFGVGLNYRAHAEEANMEIPKSPVVFCKFNNCLAGATSDVIIFGPTVDWEAELVVVMGSTARDIPADDAWKHVAGLTCGQDITERATQFASQPPQFDLGKSFDTYGPIGPCVVSTDSVPDPARLHLTCEVNGERKQETFTDDLIFGVPEIISYLSSICTLEPGDLIFTGTPSGVGFTTGTFLQPGDEVVTAIEGLGTMRNRCVARPG